MINWTCTFITDAYTRETLTVKAETNAAAWRKAQKLRPTDLLWSVRPN